MKDTDIVKDVEKDVEKDGGRAEKKLTVTKVENIAVAACFLLFICVVLIASLISPSKDLSTSERRRLAQFPEFSVESIFNGKFMKGFDEYSIDQIAFRDQWRGLKACFDLNAFWRYDVNGNFIIGDMIFKLEYPFSEKSVKRLCDIINYCDDQYLDGLNVYYAIIPDKNYFLDDSKYLTLDYPALADYVRANIREDIKYIDLFDSLTLDSYFLTDSHWRQEKLGSVVTTLSNGLGVPIPFDISRYSQEVYSPFYGVFYGQLALKVKTDELIYLVNDTTKNAEVVSLEKPGELLGVYDLSALGGMDSYNVFLMGPVAVLTIENPAGKTGRGLVIFRDSYSSSLAPLMLEGYDTITLIDLRYISPDLLGYPELVGDYVDFTNKDVLFMFSSTLFNNSDSIKSPQKGK